MADLEALLALGVGAAMFVTGLRRRSISGAWLAVSAAPFIYRGLVHHWPGPAGDSKVALGGSRGVHVRESIAVDRPAAEVYEFWRRLENLPMVMSHLESVTESADGRSHWVTSGPLDMPVEWDAEIINDVKDQLIGWRSLPGSDVTTAGSVTFDPIGDGGSTQISVHLQYAPVAGRAGAFIASLFGRDPSQTIREDLRRFKTALGADTPASAPSF